MEPDIKCRIIGVQTLMSKFSSFFGLYLCERILKITDDISRTLQAESMSASEEQFIAKQTIETLVKMRTDAMFDIFYKHTLQLKEKTH